MGVKSSNQLIALTHLEKQELYKVCAPVCPQSKKHNNLAP